MRDVMVNTLRLSSTVCLLWACNPSTSSSEPDVGTTGGGGGSGGQVTPDSGSGGGPSGGAGGGPNGGAGGLPNGGAGGEPNGGAGGGTPPEAPCSVVLPGEYGNCERVLGYGVSPGGQCEVVSGCACDETCVGRVFDTPAACQTACLPACMDADADGLCDANDGECSTDEVPVLCDRVPPICPPTQVPVVANGCYTDACVDWRTCAELVAGGPPPPPCGGFAGFICPVDLFCIDDPSDNCDPNAGGADCIGICVAQPPLPPACLAVASGEFGNCDALLGYGMQAESGVCGPISGCGCGERCAGRVFDTPEACAAACAGPVCRDSDSDGRCDQEDSECNSDGSLLMCRRVAPPCLGGTVPEVANGCYTDVCVDWRTCAELVANGPPPPCGGFAGFGCPEGLACVDAPNDDCDPRNGGADCPGICIAQAAE